MTKQLVLDEDIWDLSMDYLLVSDDDKVELGVATPLLNFGGACK